MERAVHGHAQSIWTCFGQQRETHMLYFDPTLTTIHRCAASVAPLLLLGGLPTYARGAAAGVLEIPPPSIPPRRADAEYTDGARRVLGTFCALTHRLARLFALRNLWRRRKGGASKGGACLHIYPAGARLGVCGGVCDLPRWCQHHPAAAAAAAAAVVQSPSL